MPDPAEPAPAALKIIQAYNDADYERGLAVVGERCEVVEVATGERFVGPDGVRRQYERWRTAIPGGRHEVRNLVEAGSWTIVEAIFSGRHEGPLEIGGTTIAPTGRDVAFSYCNVAAARDGKTAASRFYYDLATILRQLDVDTDQRTP